LPAWFKAASPTLRETLRQTMLQWHTTQTEIAPVFASIQSIEQFAVPLLETALTAHGWGSINLRTHGFKQVRLLSNAVLFLANQQTSLVDCLAKFILPESLIPTSLEVNLISSTSHHDVMQAALQNFEHAETVKGGFDPGTTLYKVQSNGFVNLPEYEPEKFARICRDLNLGEQYQSHLDSIFTPVEIDYEVTDQRFKAFQLKVAFIKNKRLEFSAELHVAFMKRHVTADNYNFILAELLNYALAWQDRPNVHSTLRVMGFEVPGMIVWWPEKLQASESQRCIVYLPQAPKQTFYEFETIDQFKINLRERLKQREFSDYFVKLIPLRYRAEFIRRIDLKKVAWDSLLLLRPPIIN